MVSVKEEDNRALERGVKSTSLVMSVRSRIDLTTLKELLDNIISDKQVAGIHTKKRIYNEVISKYLEEE